VLSWSAVAGIGSAILIMIMLSAAGPSRAVVHLRPSQAGPLLFFPLHPPQMLVAVSIWSAVVVGGAGVAAGLAAVARGARPAPRLLAGAALAVAAVLAVLPPAGSTDTLDYASYGRMVVIGHDPYVMTPRQLRLSGDPIGLVAPRPWQGVHSVYGPLATLEQAAAAELGGSTPGLILFWLKLWNALAFGAVVIGLDRLLRRDPVRRARAHLLWSLNPLLLWVLVAGGHIDALATGFGFLGLLVLRPARAVDAGGGGAPSASPSALIRSGLPQPRPHSGAGTALPALATAQLRSGLGRLRPQRGAGVALPALAVAQLRAGFARLLPQQDADAEPWAPAGAWRPAGPGGPRMRLRAGWRRLWAARGRADPGPWRGLVAGGLIGTAADLKVTFILFGLGAAWAARRSLRTLAALAAGALAVLVPSYLWFGPPAITVLLDHSTATGDNLYRIFAEALGTAKLPQLSSVALPVFVVTALLLLRRLPNGYPALPAVRPAFALSLAWLLTWPFQRPWYDAMAFCLLALYPAARLDWPLIARLVAGVLYSTPGMPGTLSIHPLGAIEHEIMVFVVPLIRLAALVAVLVLCLTAAWYAGEPLRPRLAGLVPRL
jgi:hypothetical protein